MLQLVTKKDPTPDMLLLTDSELLAPNFANFMKDLGGEEPVINGVSADHFTAP